MVNCYRQPLAAIDIFVDNDCAELVSGDHNSMKDNTVSKLCLLRAAINYFSYQDNVAASNTLFSLETFQHFLNLQLAS